MDESTTQSEVQTDDRMVVQPEDHVMIAQRRLAGETLQSIADDYGVTRERIRQIVKEFDPEIPNLVLKSKKAKSQAEAEYKSQKELLDRMGFAVIKNLKCLVCGAWVLRGNYQTCSPEHAKVWTILRTADRPNEHRRYMAQVYLNNPEGRSESQIRWAKSVISGENTERNRTYLMPGSMRAEVIRKYRPELYEELTGGKSE